jgi:thioredoxin reductase (NADPH)
MNFFLSLSLLFCTPVALLMGGGSASIKKAQEEQTVVVMGGGIGGLTSALYLARSGLNPLVIEGVAPGGLLTQSHSIQNWPGEVEIEGTALIEKVRHQAQLSGAQFLPEDIISVDVSNDSLVISTQSDKGVRQIRARASIIAMGTQPNFLGVPGEKDYWGRGVTNCAICDGPLYQDRVVGVVGGGDAAVLEALYLSKIAKEVHLFVRKNHLRAIEKKRVETLLERPNVKVHYNTEVLSIEGDREKLAGVVLQSSGKSSYPFPVDGLFLAIGSQPNSALFKDILKLDSSGYIVLSKDQQTSLEGVYAVGDIVDPLYKQAISAAGDGAKAALQAQQFIADKLGSSAAASQKSFSFAQKKISSQDSLPIEIMDAEQFERELHSGSQLVLVDFYAPWCGPCRRISPLFDALAKQLPSQVKILKVNIDSAPQLSKSYNIRSIPTLLIFNSSGKLIERKAGTEEIAQILSQVETNFESFNEKM